MTSCRDRTPATSSTAGAPPVTPLAASEPHSNSSPDGFAQPSDWHAVGEAHTDDDTNLCTTTSASDLHSTDLLVQMPGVASPTPALMRAPPQRPNRLSDGRLRVAELSGRMLVPGCRRLRCRRRRSALTRSSTCRLLPPGRWWHQSSRTVPPPQEIGRACPKAAGCISMSPPRQPSPTT